MRRRKDETEHYSDLRQRAEERLKRTPTSVDVQPDAERAVHELEVLKVELELQNQELQEARNAAEAGFHRYSQLFEFAPVGYARIDADGTIRELNQAGASLLGVTRKQAIGRRFADSLALEGQRAFRAFMSRVLADDKEHTCDIDGLAPTQPNMHLRLMGKRLQSDDPDVLLSFEDVTEQRMREQALTEANRRKDDFLATLSHELRNPLAPIHSGLFAIASAPAGSPQSRRAHEIVMRQVTHLTRLVDGLLDVTRIRRGKIQLQLEGADLAVLVRRTLEDYRMSFEARGMRVDSKIEPGEFWVHADAARLVQAFSNVLDNAEKFTPSGGKVEVSLQRNGATGELHVRDNGPGISRPLLENVFEPFAQAPQTLDRSRGGLGLGLAVVKAIIELHKGRVEISSSGSGRGTELSIFLPLDPTRAPSTSTSPLPAPTHSARRVLIIEDNADAAETLADMLAMHGHDARVAHDGPSGLILAKSFQPQVILCDIGLPTMDGYAVAAAIRAEDALKRTYVVAITGYARPEDVERAMRAGFDEHLAKPPNLERLTQLLNAAVPTR